jgi:hypothetical protein
MTLVSEALGSGLSTMIKTVLGPQRIRDVTWLTPRLLKMFKIKVCACVIVNKKFTLRLFTENMKPSRRSGRSTKGQGGALEQLRNVAAVLDHEKGANRQRKPQADNIPDSTATNPMAPYKKSKARARHPVSGIYCQLVVDIISSCKGSASCCSRLGSCRASTCTCHGSHCTPWDRTGPTQ